MKGKEESGGRKAVTGVRHLVLRCLGGHVSSVLVPGMSSQICTCFWIGWVDLDAYTFALSKIPNFVLMSFCLLKPVLNLHVKPLRP